MSAAGGSRIDKARRALRWAGVLAAAGGRMIAARIPRYGGAAIARNLRRQAEAARDARRFPLAAALYEEALRFTPGHARLHVQIGHMFKEAGDFESAEHHYGTARMLLPDDADLALQLGHFNKVAGRPDAAEAEYARALTLRPGWTAAAEELARVRTSADPDAGDDADWIVPELLPQGDGTARIADTVQIRQIGSRRLRSRWGMMRSLRGVEAVRGFAIGAEPMVEAELLLDGRPIRSIVPQVTPIGAKRKSVFNIWHDFTDVPAGPCRLEVRLRDARGRTRVRGEQMLVAAPTALPASDAWIPPLSADVPLDEAIEARPSIVRPVGRAILERPIRTILVQRADQLGDLVVSTPAIRRLRTLFPEARLVGLLTAANAEPAAALDLFDDIEIAEFVLDRRDGRRTMSITAQDDLRRRLATYAFDVAIDLGEGADSRPLLLLSGARFLYGFKDREAPFLHAGFEFNGHDPANNAEVMPPSRKILAMVDALGTMLRPCAAPLPAPDPSPLAGYGIEEGEDYAVLHTGAGLAYSRWPGFAALAVLLAARTDLRILLFSDDPVPDPAISPLIDSGRLRIVAGKLPFAHFDALLAHCAVFVGNDSGPKHLASLRGAPVVSLHMARLNWSEWGQEMTGAIVSRRVPCAGCGIGERGEECGRDFACLRLIAPEEVLAAALPLIRSRSRSPDS